MLNVPSVEKLDEFIAAEQLDPVRAYALSKEAVIVWSMLQVNALIRSGIRINTVSPAAVSTGLLPEFESAFGRERVRATVGRVGRPALPSEIADVVHYLASEQSRWINGTDIPVDGGISALASCESFGFA